MNFSDLKLKKGRERSIVNRHPWIFSGALEGKPKAEEGDIVAIKDHTGKNLGFGFYSSHSQISCRIFEFGSDASVLESKDYWFNKLNNAFLLRTALVNFEETNAYRLIHAEGDSFPGLIADVYDKVVVLQVLIKAVELRIPLVIDALQRLGFENIYLRTKSSSKNLEDVQTGAQWLAGGHDGAIVVKENNLKFSVDFVTGQKTGFFIDQRDNRDFLKDLSKDKVVLNAFSYSGGFSVYALAGGAKEVHSLDISASATQLAEENVALNDHKGIHKSVTEDCFDFLKTMPEDYYDLIVLDPPAFAKSAKAVANAARGYKQINMKAIKRIKPGGIIFTFSCSQNIEPDLFRKIIFGAAADAGRNVRIIRQLHQPGDHPVSIYHPEGEYLKGLVLWVE